MKECWLEPGKRCDECGECKWCDLDEDKICDNCCRCLGDADYNAVEITEIIMPETVKVKLKTEKCSDKTCKHDKHSPH